MMLKWIPLLPLIGFTINGFWYALIQCRPGAKKAGAGIPGLIATTMIFLSFLISLRVFFYLKGQPEDARLVEEHLFSWMKVGDFNLEMALRIDSLSTLFTLVITGVGTLIHLYSIGYMGHDATPGKFFAYLNLFCFAMLMLVMGSSLPILFLGWEGVGLCSYLLIGYWYQDTEKASAGKKAFIANRVGDFGFILGMFLIYTHFGTLEFGKITELLGKSEFTTLLNPTAVTATCLLLFLGCTGKSAQIPLYVWLPDAMAGPTPVSALIHAATMVTSGIYMLARLNLLFSLSHTAMTVIAVIGALTALLAATIAIAQNDIKKVLAYSTVSQLGYMFLACGVGAYGAGVFHVITHAFFKALMFLGAGSVIHGMHEEQDIMKMGGLKSKMPVTFVTFLVGWIAISGIPPFAGFFSKDEILWNTFAGPHASKFLWAIGLFTAMLTAFYMTRMFYLTFMGTPRFNEAAMGANGHGHHDDHGHDHGHSDDHGHGHGPKGVHESPALMTIPLVVLAVLSIVGGFIGIPHHSWLEHWLEPVIPGHAEGAFSVGETGELVLMIVSVLAAAGAIAYAWKTYTNLKSAEARKKKHAKLHEALENKWYVDEAYEATFIQPIYELSVKLWKGFDVGVIDRIVLGFGRVSQWTGQAARTLQTGSIQVYAIMLLFGLVMTLAYLIKGFM
ncbi:MAG: NADH-quinone oxidoreductase subunit L [Bdellovibrionales bacterium]|nr:NADH-quinone oxidoreductase subunit L [Bdellovibrionales bacterium]